MNDQHSAVLHVISDRQRNPSPLFDTLLAAARGGADFIQIRDKKAPASETYQLLEQLHHATEHAGLRPGLLVNDRVDIAMSLNLHGVHLAAKSMPIDAVLSLRQHSGWTGLVGCSVHTLDEAKRAEERGADYITFGHVFASESHPDLPPRGVMALRRVVDAVSIPVIAIGGIDRFNLETVLDTGCSGIAVIGSVVGAANPEEATRALKLALEKASSQPKVAFLKKGVTVPSES